MGTIVYSIKIYDAPQSISEAELKTDIDELLTQINQQMSTYIADSELSQVNQAKAGEWTAISPELLHVLQTASEVHSKTAGKFDVSVGPAVNLWHFGPGEKVETLPSESEVKQVLASIGFEKIELRTQPPAVKKQDAAIYLDLSAIAKGYAVDQVAELLKDRGLSQFMVEIGGEVQTAGLKPDGSRWKIAIEKPVRGQREFQQIIALTDIGLATSGDYRNYFEHQGKLYSHTIDPGTGKPVDHQLTSASVLHAECMLADAYATALMVLGPEQGYQWAEEHNVAALLIHRTEDGQFGEQATTAWLNYFNEETHP
ncbi:MAG: FAD:protein FMN transferase ApbE [Blastopirellula sp.]|nr:MAG: FAD:protein FMN transferase ApbE [Blastopirellula sp.]